MGVKIVSGTTRYLLEPEGITATDNIGRSVKILYATRTETVSGVYWAFEGILLDANGQPLRSSLVKRRFLDDEDEHRIVAHIYRELHP